MTATSFVGSGVFRRRARTAAGSRPPRERGDTSSSFLVTLIAVLVVAAFLSPLLRSIAYSVKSIDQITQAHSPLYPADPVTFSYNGEDLPVYNVPLPDGTTRQLAIVEALRRQSTFIDPADPAAPPIVWQGSWRTLEPVWQFAPHWENFGKVWDLIDYPRLLLNTVIIALVVDDRHVDLVHAGGVRIRALPLPGPQPPVHAPDRDDLPAGGRDDHPDVHDLPADRLGRDLAAPAGAGVLRERVRRVPDAPVLHDDPDGPGRGRRHRWRRTVPDPHLGRAAAGVAGHRGGRRLPPRVLVERLLRAAIYTAGKVDLQTVALGLQRFNGIYYREPGLIQAGTLMTLVIPVIAFLLTQRFFTRGIVITGVEK